MTWRTRNRHRNGVRKKRYGLARFPNPDTVCPHKTDSFLLQSQFVNQTKRPPGSFVGETEYFNRSSGEDAFLCAGVGESVRTIDAFACPTHGATVLVVSHETLDRLRVTRPSLALAMFSKMAGTAVQALIREIVASNS